MTSHNAISITRRAGGAMLLAAALAIASCASMSGGSAPIAQGQKIVMATHSFNVFVGPGASGAPTAGPLAQLAAERGKPGHATLAVQMIGGSTPMQHWNQGNGDDTKNIAKTALAKAGPALDVFTMSPNAKMPEEGIDLFGDYVIRTNPNARIMVQASWNSYDGQANTPSVGGNSGAATANRPAFNNAVRDTVTVEEIGRWLQDIEPGMRGTGYMTRLRTQLEGIDRRAGKQITYVVPSGPAVYELRRQVLLGNVPNVTKQSELFRDAIGHPTTPTSHLVTYVWYGAMYRESPVGLQALVDAGDPTSAARERLLQQIAWNAVLKEPKSGVSGRPVALDRPMVAAR